MITVMQTTTVTATTTEGDATLFDAIDDLFYKPLDTLSLFPPSLLLMWSCMLGGEYLVSHEKQKHTGVFFATS